MMTDEEYQFDRYYPEEFRSVNELDEKDESQFLLSHSGILQLEKLIHKLRG